MYYDDALIAAYMAREFAVKYVTKDGYSAKSDGNHIYVASRKATTYEPFCLESPHGEHDIWWQDIACRLSDKNFYILPDSLSVFEPMVGDVMINPDGMPAVVIKDDKYKRGVSDLHENAIPLRDAVKWKDIAEIVCRNGKPFFMPKKD